MQCVLRDTEKKRMGGFEEQMWVGKWKKRRKKSGPRGVPENSSLSQPQKDLEQKEQRRTKKKGVPCEGQEVEVEVEEREREGETNMGKMEGERRT